MAALIYDQIELLLICMLLGMGLTFCYDVVRIIRLFVRHKAWVIDLEDLIFWLFTAWQAFETLFKYNRGALRAYAFLGMFLGALLYIMTISSLLLKLANWILPVWKRFVKFLGKPVLILKEKFRKMLKNISSQVKMAVKSR